MTPDQTAEFYRERYYYEPEIILTTGKKRFLGNANHPRHCRFCDRGRPEVTFKKLAHALPAALGNSTLFSYYECDECNDLFGKGIENELGNWSKPMRTLARIRGYDGVPTIRQPLSKEDRNRGKLGWRIEGSRDGFTLRDYEDNPKFEIDRENNRVRFTLHRDPYRPLGVLKALVKIGLTIMPEEETRYFAETFTWVRQDYLSPSGSYPIFQTFIPGPMPNDCIRLQYFSRRQGVDDVPFAFFYVVYGNELLQVFIPSISEDAIIQNQTLSVPPLALFDLEDEAQYGPPRRLVRHLTSADIVRGETQSAVFHFAELIDNDSADPSP